MKSVSDHVNAAVEYRKAQEELAQLRPQLEALAARIKEARAALDAATENYVNENERADELHRQVLAIRAAAQATRNAATSAFRDAQRAYDQALDRIEELEDVEPPDDKALETFREILS